ncbi:hypothetical protein CDL12_14614 [Handroanthus impetiginosus]|uniref:Uncharacterized protein n=1 Tax=Handroanthus impetiginosus TaxID=429701 RepID=A0A2G9H5I2_9LAMI|nr:hypothetical protein CDL12_14614 [Handroanthus impetiginosus]
MMLSIALSKAEGPPVQEPRKPKEKQEVKKRDNPFTKALSKESMVVITIAMKLHRKTVIARGQRRLAIKEMRSRQYSFLDSDIYGIFGNLLNTILIKLLKMKRPQKVEKIDDSRYYKYHYLVGTPYSPLLYFQR